MSLTDVLGNRKHIRVKSELPIVIESLKGRIIDINIEGCLIEIIEDLSIGNQYSVTLKLPERDVIVDCACLRSELQNNLYRCVLRFEYPSPLVISCIDNYIKSVLENLENAFSSRTI